MGKKVIITGATGMVGNLVLQECLLSDEIQSILSISRKPCGVSHEKLTEIIHDDFTRYKGLEKHFNDIDIAYFCIGVYTGEVPKDEFRKITVDYTVEFAKRLKIESPNATFCFLSGQGADQTEESTLLFARSKGAAENFLIQHVFKELYIFRPGYIYPVTKRKEPNFSYRISRKIYPILRLLMPNGVITSERLARVIFNTGLKGANKVILENRDIRDLIQIIEDSKD